MLYSNSWCFSSSLSPLLSAIIFLSCTDLGHRAPRFSPDTEGNTPVLSQEKRNWQVKIIHIFFLRTQESEWSVPACARETANKNVLSSVSVADLAPPLTLKQWTSAHIILKQFVWFVQSVFNTQLFKNSSRALYVTLKTTWDDTYVFMFLHFIFFLFSWIKISIPVVTVTSKTYSCVGRKLVDLSTHKCSLAFY